ncbi:23S rRNA (uracil(1939)-C(5))-methyltransferase RlmD [uncultured Tyzzerella sp.]|uniref:23S rRNA (uracil(1939)-C(5))-methyltransferase RlmD n=1 Tax=uncultured Tyzzerella sp. TaxID=2321398 RepID=UPI0029427B56|nr:23S rRNA (uracil(1939)-C(5))-methyltransferase RlmD [uncultured Tyzzerella sp.]
MEIKKNVYFDIDIIDIGINGEGIGKIDNFTIFVDGALPNETVHIKIIKVKKNYGYGKIINIIKPSPYRQNPHCKHFGKCGGCNLLHLSYDEQLKIKSKFVQSNLKKIAKIDNVKVPKAIGMDIPFNYRNKASFPINFTDNVNIGFYKPRSHNIINIDNCIIQNPINNVIIQKFKDFIKESNISIYDENTGKGDLRHIVTRVGNKTNELLICIVVNNNKFLYKDLLIENFKTIPNLDSIVINYNTINNNVILGDKTETIMGKGYIVDYIKDLKFNISPLSFYQVNPIQTEVLYEIALNFCNLTGNEIVFDAYCGIGTISLFLAKNCKKVYGIEIVPDAIKNAISNAELNNINNAEFFVGKSEDVIPKLIFKENICPDVIVVDPPRKGCDKILLDAISKTSIKKLVYVSCDNATLARDIDYLSNFGFKLAKIQPVDMFCMTTHIECVALITR